MSPTFIGVEGFKRPNKIDSRNSGGGGNKKKGFFHTTTPESFYLQAPIPRFNNELILLQCIYLKSVSAYFIHTRALYMHTVKTMEKTF